jgi:hypothetical protein
MSSMGNDLGELYGIAAEFETPEGLLEAAQKIGHMGITRAEGYSPFVVYGVAEALGMRRRWVAPIVLVAGMLGALTGFGMCWYAYTVWWRLNIGGRPFNSWPAWIPITFELTVLFAALAGAIGMIILNGLPRLNHPAFEIPNFERASIDRFFLCVEASDPKFEPGAVLETLASCEPLAVSEVRL